MLPSRGLRWSGQAIAQGRRHLEPFSARSFSSIVQNGPLRSRPALSRTSGSPPSIYTRTQQSRTNLLIRNGVGIRFASTGPVPPTLATTQSPAGSLQDAASASAAPGEVWPSSLDSATDLSTGSILDAPEHIGYLKALGLDYGWGPVGGMQWLLEHIHILAGTPWWVSIALTAIVVRTVMLKGFMGASDNAARAQAIKPITEPLNKQMRAATGDVSKALELKAELAQINKRAGMVPWKSFVPLLQIFTGYGTFVLLRAMAKLPVPGLETGGILWFQNLTVPDPFFILPITTSLILHWVLRTGGETGAATMSPKAMKALSYGLPAISLVFVVFLPAAVQISFLVTGFLSFCQSMLFKLPGFRDYFNLYPLSAPKTGPSSPYQGTIKVREPLTQEELDRTYQSSRTDGPGEDAPAASRGVRGFVKGAVGGAVKDIGRTVGEARKSATDLMGQGRESLAGRQSKSDRAAADAYEKKRQKEIQQQKFERDRERRAKRYGD